jgi:hypothetical protein
MSSCAQDENLSHQSDAFRNDLHGERTSREMNLQVHEKQQKVGQGA